MLLIMLSPIIFTAMRSFKPREETFRLNTFLCYPLAVWMIKSFFDSFPGELVDSAIVDGCTRTGAFLRVVVPVSAVGISAVAIITFLWIWNEFLFAMVFSNTRAVQPATVGAHYFVGDEAGSMGFNYGYGNVYGATGLDFFLNRPEGDCQRTYGRSCQRIEGAPNGKRGFE